LRGHPPLALGRHVGDIELPAPAGVSSPRKGTHARQTTDKPGRDTEGTGHFGRAENRRSLPSRTWRAIAILVGKREKPTVRWCVRASLSVNAGSGTGTSLLLKPPGCADMD
jgi:hypothetical protein